ncbi:helix-turn-helix domain-containing protein [Reyranella sp.]|jgi:ribosome-binding protein aMBF1 (putative translation factor)|uniref:helix-turn-helix domain-containing protein n=1 Tax=Reyranella sp. TaxID=1929291 RepID=UPI000BC9DB0F|nr:helix-turn-helix domain-containing protein [Reyranella sp.]OYY35588.1 MAG: hypothetical protein B7Y57_25755 [Rhodospirillales bacterium 35-66-84]OYZ91458.1 MAG: hypothetical protein B7Y08_25625 [Rhodospirillales bacterium 24-66-33]OZB21995.1 MAG: hypothetical protein B7X63_24550 [Rhodospirillales bacterium 39-66-50]HQS14988.1 helix-turn-helix domain-containing protein [Reyranella sp.]HQT10797.1 helix-turn-helix domain-containing protein [Reyranella sp.]
MATAKRPTKKPKAPPDPAATAYYVAFRDRLVAAREAAGLSAASLAELLDIPASNMKQIEGKRLTRFPLHKLERLSLALRLPIEFLVTGKISRRNRADTREAA